MYEEEDDESTHAYRNLGMLMGTGHQMDRRFYAYYAHQLQMKGIVDQMIQQQQMQLGRAGMAGAGGYPQNQMYPPAGEYMPHQPQQQQQQQQQLYPLFRQQMFQMPSYRSSPYPVAHSQGRAMSMHIPQAQSMRVPQQNVGINMQNKASGLVSPVSPAIDDQNNHPRRMSAPPPTSAADNIKSLYPGSQRFESSPTQAHQLPSPASEVDDVSFNSLFPFTNELPGESARFLQGAGQRGLNMSPYSNFDLFETGTTYTTSKGFTTSLNPLQQSNPFDVKTEDGLATTNGELKWQPTKLDSSFSNTNLGAAGLIPGNVTPEDDILSSLFMAPTGSSEGFDMLGDCSSLESLSADDTVDNEAWDKFMNADWLDAATVN
jgi:hypothetical protein